MSGFELGGDVRCMLRDFAAGHGRLTVLTGAGISAESGIPTFRGPEGYWTVGSREYHPQEMATWAMFRRKPLEVWRWYLYRRHVCGTARPNEGHRALAEIERLFEDRFILITQNVDGLHLRAGSSPQRTFHIHGNVFFMRCAAECSRQIYPIPEGITITTPVPTRVVVSGIDKEKVGQVAAEIRAFRRLAGPSCKGFRAPSFSLDRRTAWALKVLAEEGFSSDSSVFPAKTPLYGLPGAPTRPYRPSLLDPGVEDERSPLLEFPVMTVQLRALRLPLGGGFYMRLAPAEVIIGAIRKLNRRGLPAVLYVHVWELDPRTPRVPLASPWRTFVTYYGLKGTARKLRRILSSARFTSFRGFMEHEGLAP